PAGQARDPPPPSLDGVEVAVDGPAQATLRPEVDENAGRVRVAWTPPAPGTYNVSLLRGGETLATTAVDVPG
ncbi:MAG TPA: hypothetical protein VNX21_04280, partial [Candidatus Thermoplasmatota archaeon]|nr:hypothetical protein [Candidatus Thermoplasmatota archaeon]